MSSYNTCYPSTKIIKYADDVTIIIPVKKFDFYDRGLCLMSHMRLKILLHMVRGPSHVDNC